MTHSATKIPMKSIIRNYLTVGLNKDELIHYKYYTKTINAFLALQNLNHTQWSNIDYINYFNKNIRAIGTDHFLENIELAVNEGNNNINNYSVNTTFFTFLLEY